MARTQAAFYRDQHGAQPVDEFIEALPAKRAAKIDGHVEEHLSRKSPDAPTPRRPTSASRRRSRGSYALRVRFADSRYRVLYRSENLIVLLHAIEKHTAAVPDSDIELAKQRMAEFKRRTDAEQIKLIVNTEANSPISPKRDGCRRCGATSGPSQRGVPGSARRVRRDPRAAQEELDRRPHPRATLRAGPDPAGGGRARRQLAFLHLEAGGW